MRKLTVCLVVVAVVAAFGASSALAGEGDLKKFCKTWVAVDSAEEGPSDKQLEKLRDTAPPDVAEPVDAAVTQFEEEGEDAFEDEAFIALLAEVDQFVLANCGFEEIGVSMRDYSFDGLPTEIEKGTVGFNLTNEGTELHEMHFIRLKGDATLEDILELPADAEEHEFEEFGTEVSGGGFAFPGVSDVAYVTFKKPGTYVALCSIPVGSTPDAEEGGTGSPHYVEGMATEFEVT
jgi:hypothetical protein